MSDFLEQFSDKNYKKGPLPAVNAATGTDSALKESLGAGSVSSKSAEATPVSNETTGANPDSMENTPAQRFFGVKSTEHDVVIDTSYNRHKTIRIIAVSAAILLLCIAIFLGYLYFSRVQMLDFTGKSIDEARTWSLKNQIELDEQYKFDNSVGADIILTQSVLKGKMIAKKSIVTLEISKGADPEQKITVPDFPSLSVPDIQAWIDENSLQNTQLAQENSSSVESGKFIRAVFRDLGVDKDHFKRKDFLSIYISKGLADMTNSVTVPVFAGMTKAAATAWSERNNVTLSYSPQISETVALDIIISQDKAAGTTVQTGSTIILDVSAGAGIAIPDFSKYLKEDAPAAESALAVTVKMQYSSTVPYGKIISQSVPAGKRVLATENKVTVTYSEGKPYIDNLKGTSEKDIAAYFYAYKLKGVTIPYTITYVDSNIEKGRIVSISKFNEFISIGETISIQVSRGNLP